MNSRPYFFISFFYIYIYIQLPKNLIIVDWAECLVSQRNENDFLTHYKIPPLRNLCLKLCHVYVPEWMPRQQYFFFLSYSIIELRKKKHCCQGLHSGT